MRKYREEFIYKVLKMSSLKKIRSIKKYILFSLLKYSFRMSIFVLPFLIQFTTLEAIEISSESAILINGHTGKVLYEKNADSPRFPASTTKIVTAYYALLKNPHAMHEKIRVTYDDVVAVSPSQKKKDNYKKYPSYRLESDGTHVGLKSDEVLSFEDLLFAALLSSANDAANVLARHISGSIPKFVEEMNHFVQELGCTNTRFYNPHGLYHPEQQTTARDLVHIARSAMQNEKFREIVRTKQYACPATNKQKERFFLQKNRLLRGGPLYPYAIGVKNGYTKDSGCSLVAAAEKDGRFLIAVVFEAKTVSLLYQDIRKIFDQTFTEQKKVETIAEKGRQSFTKAFSSSNDLLYTEIKQPFTVTYYPSEAPKLRCNLSWYEHSLPIYKDDPVGALEFYDDQMKIANVQLYAANDVKEQHSAVIWKYLRPLYDFWYVTLAVLFGLVIFIRRKQ